MQRIIKLLIIYMIIKVQDMVNSRKWKINENKYLSCLHLINLISGIKKILCPFYKIFISTKLISRSKKNINEIQIF